MIKQLVRQAEEKPAAAILIGFSVLAGVAFARSLSSRDEPSRLAESLAHSARERFDSASRSARDGFESASQSARGGLESASRSAADGLDTAGRIASRLRQEGAEQVDRSIERVQDLPRPSLSDLPSPASFRQPPPKRALSKMGIEEKTVAVFMGTLLAKSVSGYLRWRSEQDARTKGAAIAVDDLQGDEPLEEQTVVELRKQASELDIEGRSSMNKDELVDALKTV